MASTFMVSPSTPTGQNRRIELAGADLWVVACIDNVFVYPSEIKIDQLKEALSRTLSVWPLVAGRMVLENKEHYIIEMCDNPIPITFVVNDELKAWPFDSTVVIEVSNTQFPPFLDSVQVNKLYDGPPYEPLLRLKLTHIVQSNEWVLGISWYHLLGDAFSCLQFSNTLSRFYQQMEPKEPIPIFERRLWREDEADPSVLPIPMQYQDAQPLEEGSKVWLAHQTNYDQINLHFSGQQLATLRALISEDNVTIQDALTAYIILTLNTSCYKNNDERRILHTVTIVNYRGISDSIAPLGQVGNCLFVRVSDNFDDPYSLSNIAKTIRRSIIETRNPKILEPAIATIDGYMRRNVQGNKVPNPNIVPNELAVNSNIRYDWADLVDFGFTNQCRFYTAWTGVLYLRVFRLNPIRDGNEWLSRDRDGAEVAFRIEKGLKDNFLNAMKQDIMENFQNLNS